MVANHSEPPQEAPVRRGRRRAINLLICIFFIGAGVVGATYISKSAPKARKRPPAKMTPLVKVAAVYPETHQVVISAMGTVVPARELTLKSQVAGKVVWMHPEFTGGGFLKQGAPVLRVEPDDYQLTVARKQSAVIDAKYAVKLEMGHQEVAQREWELLRSEKETDGPDMELALRKPHLDKVQADLSAAEADLKQAELNLARTEMRVPFNATVRNKKVEIGSQVSTQEALAEMVGTDLYYIRVSIPSDRLKWIAIPKKSGETGGRVRILYRNGFERTGAVFKLLSDLETEGRMARILVSVADPLGLEVPVADQPPLLIGEYVRVEIEGGRIEAVYRIPRTALRDNIAVWVVGEDEKLDIRRVETVWRDTHSVMIRDGLRPGERLVVTDLPVPVAGMPLRAEGQSDGPSASPEKNSDRRKDPERS